MRAIKITAPGKAEVQTVALPSSRDTYIRVRTHSVALNPTDWKHIDRMYTVGCTVGCDFSGTVESVGSAVTKHFKPGDKVAGFLHGSNSLEPEDGSFGEYLVAKGDIAIALPENLSFEEGATLGVGVTTVGQGLYQKLALPLPGKGNTDGDYLLVYGGSTATGSLAIQYARLSGSRVISINSPHNDEFVKSLGAEKSFDYHDPECGAKIRAYTKDSLQKAFDTISEADSPRICGEALSSKGGGQISYLLRGTDAGRTDIKSSYTLAYTATGEDVVMGKQKMPANPEDREFGRTFWELTRGLLSEGKLKVHPPEIRQGGLDKVLEGLDDLRKGRVSGKKLVYNIQ